MLVNPDFIGDLETRFEMLRISEIKDRLKKLEAKQGSIKKVDEFNALTQEITQHQNRFGSGSNDGGNFGGQYGGNP